MRQKEPGSLVIMELHYNPDDPQSEFSKLQWGEGGRGTRRCSCLWELSGSENSKQAVRYTPPTHIHTTVVGVLRMERLSPAEGVTCSTTFPPQLWLLPVCSQLPLQNFILSHLL